MYCQFCGAIISENDNNCAQCGAVLKANEPVVDPVVKPVEEPVEEPVAEPVVEPVVEPNQQQNYQQPNYQQPNYQQQNYQQQNYQQPNYQQPGYQQQNYQPIFQDPYFQPFPPQPVEDPGKSLGIASLVLGIIGMVTCCCPYASKLSSISPICIIVSIVLGFIARSKSKSVNIKNNLALTGIILSFLPIIIIISAVIIIVFAIIATDGAIFTEIFRILEEAGMGEYTYMVEDMLGEFENMI